jgi:hypothetical protein
MQTSKALFTGVLRLYAAIHRELRNSVQPEDAERDAEFLEQRRRKWNPSSDQVQAKKSNTGNTANPGKLPQVPIRNFYAPLRTQMDVEVNKDDLTVDTDAQLQEATSSQAGRPPPIILTSATNLLQLQKKVGGLVKGSFEFRNTRHGTRVVTKEMTDFSAIKSFQEEKLPFTFHPKSERPIKAIIRHLPSITPAEEIYEAMKELGFEVIGIKQMSSNRRTPPGGPKPTNLPLLLIT